MDERIERGQHVRYVVPRAAQKVPARRSRAPGRGPPAGRGTGPDDQQPSLRDIGKRDHEGLEQRGVVLKTIETADRTEHQLAFQAKLAPHARRIRVPRVEPLEVEAVVDDLDLCWRDARDLYQRAGARRGRER